MKKNKIIKPDIIIEYSNNCNQFLPVSVIYVRPETNIVSYEKAIIKGLQPYANVIYMANLNGKVFIKDALILEHYTMQYQFAIYGKQEISKYPEMINEFENYFKINFNDAEIIGSFETILKLQISQEDLFHTFVDNKDFLKFYGQTIKKIKNFYVVNYDLPALFKKYESHINVFTIAIRFKNENCSFYKINQSISNEILKCKNLPVINEEKLKKLYIFARVKRTYHFSQNHIKAMFDMIDFVFKKDGSHITFNETPLGHILCNNGITLKMLKKLKECPIVYINQSDKKKLINIAEEKNSIDECVDLIKNIIW